MAPLLESTQSGLLETHLMKIRVSGALLDILQENKAICCRRLMKETRVWRNGGMLMKGEREVLL
jgi:hypothetical protein